MIPLILAATVVTVATPPPSADCRLPRAAATAAPAPPMLSRKLGELPDANAIRAVIRRVDGCQYQDVIRYQVSRAGPTYPSGTLAPVQDRVAPVQPTGR
jgi:hypothetical protein